MSEHTTSDTNREASRGKAHASLPNRTIPFSREEQATVSLPFQNPPAPQPVSPSSPGLRIPFWQASLVGAFVAGLVLFLMYQQMQLNHLANELGAVNDNMRSSDVRDRLTANDAKLQDLNNRLNYLDSKINAVDQKAQTSLDKWKAQENRGNFFTDAINNIGKSLGLH